MAAKRRRIWSGPVRGRYCFRRFENSPHMGIVAAEESRNGEHDVYVPPKDRGMAHRSYLSPDGKWVLLVELVGHGLGALPRGSDRRQFTGRQVGPPSGGCTFGAWSPDGKWMYLTSKAGGLYHIWRQRFPDGQPQQIDLRADGGRRHRHGAGRPLFCHGRGVAELFPVGSRCTGERQISLEGNAAYPNFTPDGKKLCYRDRRKSRVNFNSRDPGELWVADLESGRSEPLVPGFQPLDYDISADGKQIVMEAEDPEGTPRFWLTPFERKSVPRPIPNVEGRQALFGTGEIFFRHRRFLRVCLSRSAGRDGLQKALERPILNWFVSPDGRWLVVWSSSGNRVSRIQLFRSAGGSGHYRQMGLTCSGRPAAAHCPFRIPFAEGRRYIVPLPPGEALPPIPAGGFSSEQEVAGLPESIGPKS